MRRSPALGWPGTKNGETHRVWLPAPGADVAGRTGWRRARCLPVFAARCHSWTRPCGRSASSLVSRTCTPHDLRRTHGTTITALGFGRDAMNRVQNHKEGGIGSVYDRHQYADENKRIMEAVAARILSLATGETETGNVALFRGKINR